MKHTMLTTRLFLLLCLGLWGRPCPAAPAEPVRIGVPLNFPSFSYQDEGEDEVRGYGVDVLNTICRKLGKQPGFLVGRNEDLLRALRDKDLDMVIGIVPDESRIPDFNILEISIFVKQYSFIHHPQKGAHFYENPDRSAVVVVKGQPYIASGPARRKKNLIRARTVKEALFMVNSGRAKEYIDFSNQLVTYLIGLHGLQNIRQAGVHMSRFPLTIITDKHNTALKSGLSLALGTAIKSGELDRVREKWLGESYSSYLMHRFGPYFYGGAILAAGLILLAFLWHTALKRRVKKITLKLRETEQRYCQLIESSPDMVFLINRQGAIRLANTSACHRLKYKALRLEGMTFHDLVDKDDQERCRAFLFDLFDKRPAATELRLKDRQKNSISVEIAAAILRRGSASERLACCFARDITHRKRMERELIRTERLATMGRMAAGMAHEVNNPLGIILSHTEELLNDELTQKEMQVSLGAIRRNAVRAGNITDTLLNRAADPPVGKEICDFARLTLDCLHFLRPRMKKITPKKQLEPEKYWIQCDESQIQQVLINLLLNAVESMKRNGVIRVALAVHEQDGAAWNRLRIEDNGSGIRDADKPFVFDPFFTRDKKEGKGLGLFVAERIITKHGGRITVADADLGGAAMIVDLPRVGGADANSSIDSGR